VTLTDPKALVADKPVTETVTGITSASSDIGAEDSGPKPNI
jgi:hypothetical protein